MAIWAATRSRTSQSGILKPGQSVTVEAAVGCDGGAAFLVGTGQETGSNGAAVYYMPCR